MSRTNEPVRGLQTLKEFHSAHGRLTLDDRKTIVEHAAILLEQTYVHLPLKVAMYAVDPVRRLRILLRQLDEPGAEKLDEMNFHKEVLEIFTSLRDLHTNYILPEPFSNYIAILPFIVESYGNDEKFLVTHLGAERFRRFLPATFNLQIPSTFKKA